MKLSRIFFFVIFLFSIYLASCSSVRPARIRKIVTSSPVLNTHFTGFALYDPVKKKMVAEVLADRYFTPASNTKLFTFFAALNMLGDSIPALQYVERRDSLICWGTADASFLNPSLDNGRAFSFLKSAGKPIYLATGRYTGNFFGYGWMWDDYNGDYQPEITEFPIFENMAHFSSKGTKLRVSPGLLDVFLNTDTLKTSGKFSVRREFMTNEFSFPAVPVPPGYMQSVPFKVDTALVRRLLQDTLKRPVALVSKPVPRDVRTLYSIKSDTLYKHMLQPSDNFLAEHLLLACAVAAGKPMNTTGIINYVTSTYLANLPDKPQWVDGSGLSRMNLFTPRDMVLLLEKIYAKAGNQERLFDLFPAGGKTGTLKNLYKSGKPFVFAKTGTLSNNYSQSGYLLTRRGKRLTYSFMNNNYVNPAADVRKEMERIVTWLYERY
ncbi:D-alanyl-D-alanine carboxypeptidase/D-alanyl-D-alanine-endopeptidase [Hufsiella ginkgonis]|uniref:Peptidase S13 n=1 Tax=Hufsiella ginkgonis TaxID=2695274 RepID=A0A7K1XU01_9SPHI|nr:D-alanyl-D-alanine carboxypeptidase [Hufsiella ginkgonis]MXV14239.1 peptidase S13 [Hufsiella ginkgonis]